MENWTSRIIFTNPTELFFAYHATSIIPSKMIISNLNIAADEMPWKIFKVIQAVGSNMALEANTIDHCYNIPKVYSPILFVTQHLSLDDQG